MARIAGAAEKARNLYTTPAPLSARLLTIFRIFLLLAILAVTNLLVVSRVDVLLTQGRMMPLLVLGAMWIAGIAAMAALLFEPRAAFRMFWGLIFAAGGASAFAFQALSHSEMSVFDALSFLEAAHEGGRAMANFIHVAALAGLIAVATIVLYAPGPHRWKLGGVTRLAAHGACAGLIAAMAAIIFLKEGSGTQGLPKQFSQSAIGAVAGFKQLTQASGARASVRWVSARDRSFDRIVMLVDESIRADYIDFSSHNGETPSLAFLAPRLVDFGPAASGGICSNYSNAILRFTAARKDLGSAIHANPTIWQYAKSAGYRTVFIDAQAHSVGGGGLQNFMTLSETHDIDKHYRIDAAPHQADEELRKILVQELGSNQRVFIYANKEGAHFPYDINYPAAEATHHPTQTEAGKHTLESNVASYRNAISWNVNRFMEKLFAEADMRKMALVYTSDHGQQLQPGNVTHCLSENPDPRMAYVPMFTYTSDAALNTQLQAAALASKGRASHFQIAPSLLSFMGFREQDIATRYNESLTRGPSGRPQFTTRDVMGLFSRQVMWNDIDLNGDYREKPETPVAVVMP
jgi:glucan phosphoethanolaminetransferase (alkaline phosphatase superfamily)